ncbi:MAG: hypothetical protein IJ204_07895 [Paludibacteraceae bacterium]|nr:hypothetical protein [Paludibacteraceae bacterium]
MKRTFIALVLGALLTIPCVLHAEEIEIQLTEVIQMNPLPGNDPLDGNDHMGDTPTRPTSFRATVDGRTLSVSIEEPAITGAQLRVYKQGGLVVNRFFSSATAELLTAGSYSLEIETDGGLLIGTFDVE